MKNKEQEKQYDVKYDKPFKVEVGKKTYGCNYLKTWVADRIAKEIVKANVEPSDDMKETILFISQSGALAPKVISMLILGSWWKIKLFHWAFSWYVYRACTPAQNASGLSEVLSAMDMSSFFLSIRLVEAMNTMRMKATQKAAAALSLAEQQSAKTPPSETNSAG